jgi:hypothetical protein
MEFEVLEKGRFDGVYVSAFLGICQGDELG